MDRPALLSLVSKFFGRSEEKYPSRRERRGAEAQRKLRLSGCSSAPLRLRVLRERRLLDVLWFQLRWTVLLFSLVSSLGALELELSAQAQAKIGDEVDVTITLRYEKGWKILTAPDPVRTWPNQTWIKVLEPVESRDGNVVQRRQIARILADATGTLVLSGLSTIVEWPDGTRRSASAAAVVIEVSETPGNTDLPSPSGIYLAPPSPLRYLWWGIGIITVLAIAATIIIPMVLRRRRERQTTPFERLEREMARAQRIEEIKERSTTVSIALRRYAGEKAGFDGAGATTLEVRSLLSSFVSSEELANFLNLLSALDGLRWRPEGSAETIDAEKRGLTWARNLEERLNAEAAQAALNTGAKP